MKKKEKIKLVFGLGNEGKEFYGSRHNIGKEIIDFYIEERKEEKSFYFAKYNHLILASNKGYMNESGKSVKEALKFFKLKPENLLVIHDEADLLFLFLKFLLLQEAAGIKV
jgi:peptidyl-tRNA hydrolase, PTH1 family